MTEKEKMLSQKLYNANYDVDILNDRTQVPSLQSTTNR